MPQVTHFLFESTDIVLLYWKKSFCYIEQLKELVTTEVFFKTSKGFYFGCNAKFLHVLQFRNTSFYVFNCKFPLFKITVFLPSTA